MWKRNRPGIIRFQKVSKLKNPELALLAIITIVYALEQ